MSEELKRLIDVYHQNAATGLTLWNYLYVAAAALLAFGPKELRNARRSFRILWTISWILFGCGNLLAMQRFAGITYQMAQLIDNYGRTNPAFHELARAYGAPKPPFETALFPVLFIGFVSVLFWRLTSPSRTVLSTPPDMSL